MSKPNDETDCSTTGDSGQSPATEKFGTAEFSQLVREHQNTYIRVADQKASILLSGLVAYLGLALNVLGAQFTAAGRVFAGVASASVLCAIIAIGFAAAAVYPSTPETPQGLVMWESITSDSMDEYRAKLHEASDMDFTNELIDENYKLAEVNNQKYARVRKALWFTAGTVLFGLVSLMLIAG